jgi:hypothetical protein
MIQPVLSVLLPNGQPLDAVFKDALFDPNTGIVAGFLNARDDLATAILNANDDFPSQLGKLATLEWQHMPELLDPASNTDPAELAALLNPADLVGG